MEVSWGRRRIRSSSQLMLIRAVTDLFNVIQHPSLLTVKTQEPAKYPRVVPRNLDRECTVSGEQQ